MNLVSQLFGIVMAIGGFVIAFLKRDALSSSVPLIAFCGGLILVGAFLLTPEKMKAAMNEIADKLPWKKG